MNLRNAGKVQSEGLYFKTSGKYFGVLEPGRRREEEHSVESKTENSSQKVSACGLSEDGFLAVEEKRVLPKRGIFSGYGGNFITVAYVKDVWSVVLRLLPVPAGKVEQKENDGS